VSTQTIRVAQKGHKPLTEKFYHAAIKKCGRQPTAHCVLQPRTPVARPGDAMSTCSL
jgi:hypothetical protein